jgi:ribosomal protein S21
MAINVEITKNNNESSANIIRRFTKRVQGAGIVPKVRSGRYFTRIKSRNVQRFSKLKKACKARSLRETNEAWKNPRNSWTTTLNAQKNSRYTVPAVFDCTKQCIMLRQ